MNILLLGLIGFLGWMFLFSQIKGKSHCRNRLVRGGGDEDAPVAPSYTLPDWAQDIPTDVLNYLNQAGSTTLSYPSEYSTVADTLNQLLNYQTTDFAYPMTDIQSALASQQALQLEDYQKQIRANLAKQGQLDSTYYTDLLSNYLKNQQSQSLTNTANLLTNQAEQNYNLQTWLPQFKTSVAQALQNLGTSKSGIDTSNLSNLYSVANALNSLYGTGLNQANSEYTAALNAYQQQLDEYNQNQTGGLFGGLMGSAGGLGLGLALAPFTGGMSLPLTLGLGAAGGAAGALGSQGTGGSLFSTGLSAGLGSLDLSSLGLSNQSSYAQTGIGNVLTALENYYQTGGNIRNIRGIPWYQA